MPPPIELQHILVILKQTAPVGHGKEGNAQLLGLVIELGLYIHAHRRSTLVQNGKQRPVVEQTSHGDPLLLTSRKHIVPVVGRIKSLLTLLNVVQLHPFQELSDLVVFPGYAVFRVRVDNLVSESAWRQVRTLRNVEQLIHVRTVEHTSCQRPKSAQYTEK